MTEQRTLKGVWWSPEAPERQCFGVLAQSGDGIELTCHSENGDVGLVRDMPFATVHGRDEKGSPVTLLAASWSGSTRSGGMETVRLNPGYVLVGVHAADQSAIRLKTLELRLQHLYGWLGLTGFSRTIDATTSGKVTISYNPPALQPLSVRSGLSVVFGLATNYSTSFQSQSITEKAVVCLTHEGGFSLRECWKVTASLRTLLHLAVLKPVYAVSMTLRGCGTTGSGNDASADEVSVWSSNLREAETQLLPDGCWVFRYGDVSADFGAFLGRWLDYTERQSEAIGCYSTTIYHRLPSTVEHLCLTQALDAYHGVTFNSHHQRDFEEKVRQLCERNAVALAGLIPDVPVFAKQVKVTRNYYTHHNPKWMETGKVAQGSLLVRMNELLRILFQSCVLADMDVPLERMARLRRQMAVSIIDY